MAHITGGGIPENLPRCLGAGKSVEIDTSSWVVPPIFQWLAETGNISEEEMFNTFNMGIGFAIALPSAKAEESRQWFESQGIAAYTIGIAIDGNGTVVTV